MLPKCVKFVCLVAIFVAVYFPARHARHYDYVPAEQVISEIVLNAAPRYPTSLRQCTYRDIILHNQIIPTENVTKQRAFEQPLLGGEFTPKHCTSLIKSAVIVPYRNRTSQLKTFLNYMHHYLQQQNIHYRIIIVEQNNSLPFNRAKMINYGSRFAMEENYSCLILHDVDLIPLSTGNLYGCSKRPRHMSSSLDTFRYNLPYLTLFGGAIAILADQFKKVNGMSNLFNGWGGEDDDFYKRLEANEFVPYRFAPEISKYTMLVHTKQPKNEERFKRLQNSLKNIHEGLNNLPTKYYSVLMEDLFTRIVVN